MVRGEEKGKTCNKFSLFFYRIVCQTTKADNKSIGGPVKLKMTYRDDPVVSQQSFTFKVGVKDFYLLN